MPAATTIPNIMIAVKLMTISIKCKNENLAEFSLKHSIYNEFSFYVRLSVDERKILLV